MTEHIQITTADRVTTLRFARPDKKNAITVDMYAALTAALAAAGADPGVRAVVIAGSPSCFTAGNDLGDFLRVAQGGGAPTAAVDFLSALAACAKPIVAAVNGIAIGIGTTLLLHCDLVYAAPTATFRTPFVELGLVPEAGSSLLLPALIGARRAARMLLLAEAIDAPTALDWGLVTGVADDADAAAADAARRLARGAPAALRATKALVWQASREALREAMAAEVKAFTAALQGPEAAEALRAFGARRSPDFSDV